MKQVLFDRQKTNLAQCISDGTIYFVKDSNGNFTQIALGDGSKSHVVGIGPKMDDATKQELMSRLGLTITTNMGMIKLGNLTNHNGVSSQKVVIYENNITGTEKSEIANVGYVQQYMKAAQALVYAGLLDASTGEITSPNTTIIQNPSEGSLTLNSLLRGNEEGESYLKAGMAFVVGTSGSMWYDKYPYIDVQGEETDVEVGDMIIITNVQHIEQEGDTEAHNEASIIIVQNNIETFKGGDSDAEWLSGQGVPNAMQVYSFVARYVRDALNRFSNLFDTLQGNIDAVDGKVTALEGRMTTVEGNITTINGEISTIKSDLAGGKYHTSWEGE